MKNLKKAIALAIVMCTLCSTLFSGATRAQTLDDAMETIPVVEFASITRGMKSSGYDDAKVITISEALAKSTPLDQVKSLIRSDDVMFFKDMSADDVSALIGEPTLMDDSTGTDAVDNGLVVGTAVTLTDSVFHFIECLVANAETLDETCPECGQTPEPIQTARLAVLEEDYSNSARSAYAITKMKGFNDCASFPTGAKTIYTQNATIKNFGKTVGTVYCNIYLYAKADMNINGASKKVYDCLASYCVAPTSGPKVLRIEGYLGYKDSAYSILERTRIPSSKPKTSVELALEAGTSNVGASFTTQWTFDSEAFKCTNDFSNARLAHWIYKPVSPDKGDARGFAPGIRMYTANNAREMQIHFKVTGVLNNCFIFHAKKTIDLTKKFPF